MGNAHANSTTEPANRPLVLFSRPHRSASPRLHRRRRQPRSAAMHCPRHESRNRTRNATGVPSIKPARPRPASQNTRQEDSMRSLAKCLVTSILLIVSMSVGRERAGSSAFSVIAPIPAHAAAQSPAESGCPSGQPAAPFPGPGFVPTEDCNGWVPSNHPLARRARTFDDAIYRQQGSPLRPGAAIFRFDTFGDEAYWGDTLHLHQALAGAANGGVGPGVSPRRRWRSA